MARHLLKLTWNRKGANALVMLEIFVSFLVVFAVVAVTVKLGSLYFLPLGFEAENLWNVGIRTGVPMFDGAPEGMGERVDHLARELEGFDAVDGVAVSTFEPYLSGQSVMTWGPEDGRLVDTEILRVSTNYHAVMGLELVAGRFFEPGDEALHWKPVVVSTELARDIFGEEDPVGRVVISRGEDEEIEQRVVGVVSTFRRSGEFQPPRNVLFEPTWPTGVIHFPRRHLQLRMAPGTPADFEETVIETLRGVAPGWSFDVQQVADVRERYLRDRLTPLVAAALVAGFLMLMVALGLSGVLWQSVTQRTRELGLRRAKGATRQAIHRQILAELLLVATFGILLAALILGQVWALGLLDVEGLRIEPGVFAASLGLSTLLLLGLTALCGLYPSWLATRVEPAEALHYE